MGFVHFIFVRRHRCAAEMYQKSKRVLNRCGFSLNCSGSAVHHPVHPFFSDASQQQCHEACRYPLPMLHISFASFPHLGQNTLMLSMRAIASLSWVCTEYSILFVVYEWLKWGFLVRWSQPIVNVKCRGFLCFFCCHAAPFLNPSTNVVVQTLKVKGEHPLRGQLPHLRLLPSAVIAAFVVGSFCVILLV